MGKPIRFRRDWYIILPLLLSIFAYSNFIDYFVGINFGGLTHEEAVSRLFSEGFGNELLLFFIGLPFRAYQFGVLSLILYLLGKKIPRKLLVPVFVMGLAAILITWHIFFVDFYIRFYWPDAPRDGMVGLEIIGLPFIMIPFLAQGIAAGLLISLFIAAIINLKADPGIFRIKPERGKWYVASAAAVLCLFIFVIIPWDLELLRDYNYRTRARSHNASEEQLVKIYNHAYSEDDQVYFLYLAQNPNIPRQILIPLAASSEHRVRRACASNPECPPEILERLSNDSSKSVRAAVCYNGATPVAILIHLTEDEDENVRNAAVNQLNRRDPFYHLREPD